LTLPETRRPWFLLRTCVQPYGRPARHARRGRRALRSRVASVGHTSRRQRREAGRNMHGKRLTGDTEPPDKRESNVMSARIDSRPYRRLFARLRRPASVTERDWIPYCRSAGSAGSERVTTGRAAHVRGIQIIQ
jgi:hypothetical protein